MKIISNIELFYIKYIYYYSVDMFLDKFRMKCKNFGKDNQLLLFDILDYIVEQGNLNTWVSVSSKKFLTFILDILKNENDAEIQTKLLQLIQSWGMDFEKKKNVVPNFSKIYQKFKINGVVFPPREEPNYYRYILNNESSKQNYKNEYESNNKNQDYKNKENDDKDEEESTDDNEFEYINSLKNILKVSNFEHKYRRLIAHLLKMHANIKSANIAIDRKDLASMKEPINTIRKGNNTLMETISSGRLKDEKLMEITLGTTEDINQTLSREEEMKSGNRPNKYMSYFVLNEIIPIKNKVNNKTRSKSERKKQNVNNLNKNEMNNNNNNQNIKNVDDIFDLFSSNQPKESQSNFPGGMRNNDNQNNNLLSNYYSNPNTNNNFFNNQNSNNFNNDNNFGNNNMNSNNNFNQNNFNNNRNNQKNNIDLLQESINMNVPQNNNNNFNNMNFNQNNNNQNKGFNPNEFDMYGPSPEVNSNQLVQYIGTFNNNNNNNRSGNFNNNNNNLYPSFNSSNQNNNMLSQDKGNSNFGNNNMMCNNFENNMNANMNPQMSQEDIEREKRLKELDDLF